MTKENKVVPLSVIEAWVEGFKTNGYRNNYDTTDVREILEGLRKEAIEAIPIEKIVAFIKQYQNEYNGYFILEKLREILE